MALNLDNPKQLTVPVVVTKPTEALATVDVYKEKGRGIVNSFQDKAKSLGINLSAIAEGAKAGARLLPLITAVKSKDPQAILDRLMAASGKNGPLLKILPESYRDTASSILQDYGGQVVMLNNVAHQVSTTNFEDINSLSRFVNNVTNNPEMMKYTDTDGVAGALASIVIEAKDLGLPSMLTAVNSTVSDVNIVMRTSMYSLPSAIRYSDTQLLREINDYVGPGNLYSAQPTVVRDFIQQYQLDYAAQQKPTEEVYRDLVATLDKVNPNWRTELRSAAPTPIKSAMFLRSGSGTFQLLMRDGASITKDVEMQMLLATDVLPRDTVRDSIKRLFKTRYER
jgi:hypothetical protein